MHQEFPQWSLLAPKIIKIRFRNKIRLISCENFFSVIYNQVLTIVMKELKFCSSLSVTVIEMNEPNLFIVISNQGIAVVIKKIRFCSSLPVTKVSR